MFLPKVAFEYGYTKISNDLLVYQYLRNYQKRIVGIADWHFAFLILCLLSFLSHTLILSNQ